MDTIPVAGAAKIWTAKPIAMKVRETPAMALSIAARGMTERNVPTKRTPTSSSRPRRRHAHSPASYALRAATAAGTLRCRAVRYTGAMIRVDHAKNVTMLMPCGSAVTG